MDRIKKRLIHLSHCRSVGWKTLFHFIKRDSSLLDIYNMSFSQLLPYFQHNLKQTSLFYEDLHRLSISQLITKYEHDQIKIITILDESYPHLLKQIYDPPWVLYIKGNENILNMNKKISVVGTRMPSVNGLKSLEKVVKPLVQNEWVIVSGLANGIDTKAHLLAIQEKGFTISVLGGGFWHIYPNNNGHLARKIAQEHLLLSEYPPDQKPRKWQFPKRNRIISGLAAGTLVVEAKEKGGSLITADQALEQGREVFAIPGSILESRSDGTNKLIQKGAKLVLNYCDILEEISNIS